MVGVTRLITELVREQPPYKALADIVGVAHVASITNVLVSSNWLPPRTAREFVEYGRRHVGELNYASLGIGSSAHLATVLFSQVTGIKLQHVPYPTGFSQAVTDMMTGRTSLWLSTLGGALGNVQGGKMRGLAVSGRARAEALPDVPTFKEQGVAMEEESTWFALFAPKGTPKEIVAKVNADVERILAQPDVKERGVTLGYRYVGGSPDKLAGFLKSEIAKWAEVARNADLVTR
jgi:tripartite-type tricarboxylate transporter receptor subunit TctC